MSEIEIRKNLVDSLVKVNKTRAIKLVKEGKKVYCIPCNLNPLSPWVSFFVLKLLKEDPEYTVEKQIDEIMYYNCDNESGKYLRYFITEVRTDE